MDDQQSRVFRDSHEDIEATRHIPETAQTRSSAYTLAFADNEFLCREELRPVRLQLELLKAEMLMNEAGVNSTVVLFGGSRIPAPDKAATAQTVKLGELSKYYEEARRFARMVTEDSLAQGGTDNVICTGGGPGVMEAGNKGASEAGGISVGLNIVLPQEQAPNAYVTPELSFNFHYFAIRKMHFLVRASAVVLFPGGFGTLDEMFETLTLIQTKRMRRIPVLLFGRAFWENVINWRALAEAGTISSEDLELFVYVETAEEAFAALASQFSDSHDLQTQS